MKTDGLQRYDYRPIYCQKTLQQIDDDKEQKYFS